MSKRRRIIISDWAAIVSIAMVIASYVWTISFEFSGIKHGLKSLEEKVVQQGQKLDRLDEKVDNLTIEVRSIDNRLTAVEQKVSP